MTADSKTPDTPQQSPPRRIIRRLLLVLVVALLVCGGVQGFRFFRFSDPQSQIEIAPETTVLTEPLTPSGDVDFLAAMSEQLSEGVTTENNALVLIMEATGPESLSEEIRKEYLTLLGTPSPTAHSNYLTADSEFAGELARITGMEIEEVREKFADDRQEARSVPWTRNSFPSVASLINVNEGPLDLMVDASLRPRYFSPLVTVGDDRRLIAVVLPANELLHQAIAQLTARSMLRLGGGDAEGSWEDLLACHRLARLTGESSSVIGALVTISLESMSIPSNQAFLASEHLTAEQARQCLQDLESLPDLPVMADIVDKWERIIFIDSVVNVMRGGTDSMEALTGSGPIPSMKEGQSRTLLNASIDWNTVLKVGNERFDGIVAAMRIDAPDAREAELDRLADETNLPSADTTVNSLIFKSFLGNRQAASRELAEMLLDILAPRRRRYGGLRTLVTRKADWFASASLSQSITGNRASSRNRSTRSPPTRSMNCRSTHSTRSRSFTNARATGASACTVWVSTGAMTAGRLSTASRRGTTSSSRSTRNERPPNRQILGNRQKMSERSGNSEAPPNRAVRVVLWLLGGCGVALLICCGGCGFRFWTLADPDEQITVSPETTVFTAPLKPSGDVDLIAAMNGRLSEGITTENNAVVLLVQAIGPSEIPQENRATYFAELGIPELPEQGNYLVGEYAYAKELADKSGQAMGDVQQAFSENREEASTRLWTRDEFPDVAAMLERNSEALDLVVQASQRPRYYSPLIADEEYPMLIGVLLPIEQQQREAVRQLTARAMLRLSEGDAEGAWEDLLTCHRLARRLAESWSIIAGLVSIAIESMTAASDETYLESDVVTAEQARRCLQDLQNLPPLPVMADVVDRGERLMFVDSVTIVMRGGTDALAGLIGTDLPADESPSTGHSLLNAAVDWDIVLAVGHEHYDEIVAAMRIEDYEDRAAELQRISDDFHPGSGAAAVQPLIMKSLSGDRDGASREFGELLLALLAPAVPQARLAETRGTARYRLVLIGFALTVHQREHGEFPETLDALVPDPLDDLPLDPHTGQPFIYQRTDDGGFRLYSVGENLQDDGGASFDDDPRGDDIIIVVQPE